jgi:hypothetical protein
MPISLELFLQKVFEREYILSSVAFFYCMKIILGKNQLSMDDGHVDYGVKIIHFGDCVFLHHLDRYHE